MQIVLSHLTGNPNSCAATLAFAEAGDLSEFHTTIAVRPWLRLVASRLGFNRGIWNRRVFPTQIRSFLRSHPSHELLRLACRGSVWLRKSRWGRELGSLDQVLLHFDHSVARAVQKAGTLDLVYAYLDAAEQTFLAAKQRGCRTIYELPTPYWRFTRGLVAQEAALQPDWAATLPVMDESSEAMQRRDRELQLADVVIVPSELVRDSLKLAPPFRAEVHVVPYGCPELVESSKFHVSSFKDAKLRVLYVGSLNQGKGLAYLAEAMTGLEQESTLTVIGSRTSDQTCAALDRFLAAHRHRSGLTHDEVLREMRQHDVLVLPTLYEGLALVLLEAMACGLTVITTEHSGLAALIEDGKEGGLVPLRDPGGIRERLRQLANNPERLQSMRHAALDWSRRHSWQRYRQQLREVVCDIPVQ